MDRLVAVKVLPAASMKSPDAVQRFYREVKAAARLNHPNIVQAHDASEHEGIHYLVMEYVDGDTLSAVVKQRGPLEVRQALDCILQAAKGLAYAHSEGVIHRDIKPGNLLLDKKGTIKILDMGLARMTLAVGSEEKGDERLTQSGQVMGTCDYMAPEQAQDTRKADQRSDIYSLGCTLYRLLTGKAPYSGDSLVQILLAHQNAPIPSLRAARPDVPESVPAIFEKMMAKRPEDRYQSMGELMADVEDFLGRSMRPPVAGLVPEPPSELLPESLAFLQEAPQSAAAAKQRKGTLAEDTFQRAAHEDMGMGIVEKVKRAVASVRGTPWAMLAVAGGVAALVVITGLVLTIAGKGRTATPAFPEGKGTAAPPLAIAPFDAATARNHQEAWAKHLGVDVETTNSIGMKFVLVPPGEFEMGSTQEEVDRLLKEAKEENYATWYRERVPPEAPRHRVRLTKPFYLGACEVTVGAFRRFVADTGYKTDAEKDGEGGLGFNEKGVWAPNPEFVWHNPSFAEPDSRPVVNVSWNDAEAFCQWLSGKEGKKYRLPTEAEWEYACRAGSTLHYCFGDDATTLEEHAWYSRNSGNKTHPVGEKKPNAWGLYDMHGNVTECCADWYDSGSYANSSPQDPAGPRAGRWRVHRGGSWYLPAGHCRSATRNHDPPGHGTYLLGLRICRVAD
jgi:formylglycine-generating enzyme required for sulfatase activity